MGWKNTWIAASSADVLSVFSTRCTLGFARADLTLRHHGKARGSERIIAQQPIHRDRWQTNPMQMRFQAPNRRRNRKNLWSFFLTIDLESRVEGSGSDLANLGSFFLTIDLESRVEGSGSDLANLGSFFLTFGSSTPGIEVRGLASSSSSSLSIASHLL